jgi:hypothetical protein
MASSPTSDVESGITRMSGESNSSLDVSRESPLSEVAASVSAADEGTGTELQPMSDSVAAMAIKKRMLARLEEQVATGRCARWTRIAG